MADGASPTLSPKEAIALGMKYFSELMEDQPTLRVLLEGLKLDHDNGNWVVTFGFDSKREKPISPSPFSTALSAVEVLAMAHMAPEIEIVREFRSIFLSSVDGKFIKLEHA